MLVGWKFDCIPFEFQQNNLVQDAGASGLNGPIAREFVEEAQGPDTVTVTTRHRRMEGETALETGSRK